MAEEEEIIEESELEEETEEQYEEIDDHKFTQFMQTQRIAPTLNQIQTPQAVSMEQNIMSTPTIDADEETNQIRYDVTTEEQRRKYEIASQGSMDPTLISTISNTRGPELLDSSTGRNILGRGGMEPEMIERGMENTKKKLPFEQDDKRKYTGNL